MHHPPRFKRLVVKLGTSVLTGGTSRLSPRRMLELARQVAALCESGCEVIVVSSGAMAAGREHLQNPDLGPNIPAKQMLAAVGQPRLMYAYSDIFALFEKHVAQVLLTSSDFRDRKRYLNARDTLEALLEQGVIPIVNENDTTATQEIRLGDNDSLSALVANLIDADLLALLTDQPGLFSSDPRADPDARLINRVEQIDETLWEIAGGAGSALGTGGMTTKLQAAQLATRAGTTVVIAAGARPDVLLELVGERGETIGTWFRPVGTHLESRKRWIISEAPQGALTVDAGAARSLQSGGASLLPVGLAEVAGDFDRGVIVRMLAPDGAEIGRGLVKYGAADLRRIAGCHSAEIESRLGYTYGDEVIHRDDLVLV